MSHTFVTKWSFPPLRRLLLRQAQGYLLLITLRGKTPPQFFEEVFRARRFAPCPKHLFKKLGRGGRRQK